MPRKICVVTGSRAEYGLLFWIMKEIQNDPDLQLLLAVTGTHLMPSRGETVRVIEQDGFQIDARVDVGFTTDLAVDIAKAIGTGVRGFAEALCHLRPDLLLVLGDRYETFAACVAAVPLGIPIAHIHGGETSQGSMDEVFRHSITKMSHFHFVSTETYRKRVIQLGEAPNRVFCVGTPALDQFRRINLIPRETILSELGLKGNSNFFLVTFHPTTLEKNTAAKQLQELFEALDLFPEISVVFTQPNADTGAQIIRTLLEQYVKKSSGRAVLFETLGQQKYLSALKHAKMMIGNSSSALTEGYFLKIPALNIGDRQKGRLMGSNVLCCEPAREQIVQAMRKGMSEEFRRGLEADTTGLFPEGNTSLRIKNKLKEVPLNNALLKKEFYDVEIEQFAH